MFSKSLKFENVDHLLLGSWFKAILVTIIKLIFLKILFLIEHYCVLLGSPKTVFILHVFVYN